MPYKEINDLRKKGFLEDATRMAEHEYAESPGKLEAIALFWCLNDRLQRAGYNAEEAGMHETLSRMKSLRLDHDPDNQVTGKALAVAESMMRCDAAEREGWQIYQSLRKSDSMPADEKWKLIERFANTMSPGQSLLNSLMIAEAVKAEKAESRGHRFIAFVKAWNLDNLRPDDWVQHDGKEEHKQSALVEKIIGAYMTAIANAGASPDDKFKSLLSKAIDAYPSNLHLYRYSAHLQAIDGDRHAAIDIIRQMLRRTPDKHYLWDDLARLIDDPDMVIGMLCVSIAKSKTDDVALGMRLRLAECLIDKGYHANALTELNRFRDIVEARGWSLKRRYYDLMHRLPHGSYPADNALLYSEYSVMANAYAFAGLPSKVYVKVWEQRGSASRSDSSWLLRHDDEEIWIKPRKHLLGPKAHNGSVFRAYISPDRQGQIVSIVPDMLHDPLPWLKIVTGPISIKSPEPSKVYGFIDGAYVPASMLYGVADGDTVSAIAILNDNKRWHALYIYK